MRARNGWIVGVGIAALGCGSSATAQSAQGVAAGELVVEPPTLISLGFEWRVEGDADRDAAVAVAYRRGPASATGATACRCCAVQQSERTITSRRSTTRHPTCSPVAYSSSPRAPNTRCVSR